MINAASVVSRIRINVIQTVCYLWDVSSSSSASSVVCIHIGGIAVTGISTYIFGYCCFSPPFSSHPFEKFMIIIYRHDHAILSCDFCVWVDDVEWLETDRILYIVCLCIARHFFDAFIVCVEEKSTASQYVFYVWPIYEKRAQTAYATQWHCSLVHLMCVFSYFLHRHDLVSNLRAYECYHWLHALRKLECNQKNIFYSCPE